MARAARVTRKQLAQRQNVTVVHEYMGMAETLELMTEGQIRDLLRRLGQTIAGRQAIEMLRRG